MNRPTTILDRVDLAMKLDDIGESVEDALTIAGQTRPEVRAPLESMLAALDEAKRRAA